MASPLPLALGTIILGGRYESADEILSKSVIPKMEGLSVSLEQMQKRLTKLDRENKLLRKETENLKFKSTYIPTSLKIVRKWHKTPY